MRRILCVFSDLNRGGSESMCMNIYRNLDRSKIQFDFVKHSASKCDFEDEITALGGRIFEAPRYRIYNHLQYVHWWNAFFKKHPEYQIIHGHFFTIANIYMKIAKKHGLITIGHAHAATPQRTLKKRLAYLLCKRLEQYCDYAFACSKLAGDWLFPKKGYTVLSNAIDVKQFVYSPEIRAAVRQEFHLGNCFVAGTVANVAPIKNPYGTLQIIAECCKRRSDFRFLWVGRNQTMQEEISQKIRQMGLSEHVIMTGVRPDVHRLLQAMDAFILPSLAEGLSISTIEAQAAGVPTFVSDAVPQEAIVTETCSQLPLTDYAAWAEAILNVNPEKRTDGSPAIRAAGYDITENAQKMQYFYLSL